MRDIMKHAYKMSYKLFQENPEIITAIIKEMRKIKLDSPVGALISGGATDADVNALVQSANKTQVRKSLIPIFALSLATLTVFALSKFLSTERWPSEPRRMDTSSFARMFTSVDNMNYFVAVLLHALGTSLKNVGSRIVGRTDAFFNVVNRPLGEADVLETDLVRVSAASLTGLLVQMIIPFTILTFAYKRLLFDADAGKIQNIDEKFLERTPQMHQTSMTMMALLKKLESLDKKQLNQLLDEA
jgi:hypothetical protein